MTLLGFASIAVFFFGVVTVFFSTTRVAAFWCLGVGVLGFVAVVAVVASALSSVTL